jgi:hypothetical protein
MTMTIEGWDERKKGFLQILINEGYIVKIATMKGTILSNASYYKKFIEFAKVHDTDQCIKRSEKYVAHDRKCMWMQCRLKWKKKCNFNNEVMKDPTTKNGMLISAIALEIKRPWVAEQWRTWLEKPWGSRVVK